MRTVTAVGVSALLVLCAVRRHELAAAIGGGAGAGALAAGLALSATSIAAVALRCANCLIEGK
jgi:hypothetical protein